MLVMSAPTIFEVTVSFVNSLLHTPPPAPSMIESILSNDGAAILMKFDSFTDRAGYKHQFECSQLVSFPYSNTSTCYWTTKSLLTATFDSRVLTPLLAGTILQLVSNRVRAECDQKVPVPCNQYDPSYFQSNTLKPPEEPTAPLISISMPSEISPCDDLIIDATGTSGSMGHPWLSMKWDVSGDTTQDFDEFRSYLNSNYTTTDNIITIPNRYLGISGATYTFVITLTNYYSQTSVRSKSVFVLTNTNSPKVYILGPSFLTRYRWQEISLLANASVIQCGKELDGQVTYTWSVFNGYQIDLSVSSASVDSRYFKVSPNSLHVNNVYTFQVIATLNGNNRLTATTFVTVTVGISGVVAVIDGGKEFTTSPSDDVVLDASSSYDKDYPLDGSLTYSWQCYEYRPLFGTLCPSSIDGAMRNTETITIPGKTLSLPLDHVVTFSFVVRVTNVYEAQDTKEILVTFKNGEYPKVLIKSPKSKYNSMSKVLLDGTVIVPPMSATAIAVWSSEDFTTSELDQYVLSTLTGAFLTNSTSTYQLAIGGGFLPAGSVYSFTLTVSSPSSTITTSAQVVIEMNAPPSSGVVLVNPVDGVSLKTLFQIRTLYWVDDPGDYPLSYVISSYTWNSAQKTIIKSKNEGSSVSTFLSQGLESQNYVVNVVVDAYDVYGDFASVVTPVKVNPIDFADLAEALESQISLAYKTLDGDKVSSVVGAATKALNGADCSMAMTCGAFNRHDCMYTPNTCGPCLNGFIGIVGDANTFCRPSDETSNGRRLSHSNSTTNVHLLGPPMDRDWEYIDGALCNVNLNCYSGHCYRGRCAAYTKKCPNECSGSL